MPTKRQRYARTFWSVFQVLTLLGAIPLVVSYLAGMTIFIFLIVTVTPIDSNQSSWEPLTIASLVFTSAIVLWGLFAFVLALLAAWLHLLFIVQPPLVLADAGPVLLDRRARGNAAGLWPGQAGRLYLTQHFLAFIPNYWCLPGGIDRSGEHVYIPLEEIATIQPGRRWVLVPIWLLITRRSGDQEPFSVWRPRRWRLWIQEASSGQVPAGTTPSNQAKRRKLTLAAMLALLAAFLVWHIWLLAANYREIARIRSEGLPVTLAQDNAFYPAPTGKNAADLYYRASLAGVPDSALENQLPWLSGKKLPYPTRGQAWPVGMMKAADRYLTKNQAELHLLHQAAAIPECRFPIDLNTGISTLLRHLGPMRHGAQLLNIRAQWEAQRGQPEKATADIRDMIRLANSLGNEPVFISRLVQISIYAMTRQTLENSLARCQFSDSQLANLQADFRDTSNHGSMARALAGQRCLDLDLFDHPWKNRAIYEGTFDHPPWVWLSTATGFHQWARLYYLHEMRELIELAKAPAAVNVNNPNGKNQGPIPPFAPERWYPTDSWPSQMTPATFTDRQQSRTSSLNAFTALAVKRYQLAHGKLPDKLDDLVPRFIDAVPASPFDGKPLHYKRVGPGAMIYSVGRDGIDHGGLVVNKDGLEGGPGADVVFTIDD